MQQPGVIFLSRGLHTQPADERISFSVKISNQFLKRTPTMKQFRSILKRLEQLPFVLAWFIQTVALLVVLLDIVMALAAIESHDYLWLIAIAADGALMITLAFVIDRISTERGGESK